MRLLLAVVVVAAGAGACRPSEAPVAVARTGTLGGSGAGAAGAATPAPADAPRAVVVKRGAARPPGDVPVVVVDVAATNEDRRRGLGGRDRVERGEGMLFVYPRPEVRTFWMKDCPFSLDIAFLDARGRVVRLATLGPGTGVADADIPRADSGVPVSFVLETAGGWLRSLGIREGDRIDVAPAAAGVVPE